MRILIADDDPQILRALRITLGARGYDVTTASDGKAALDAAAKVHPELVVLDLGMPGLSGVEVIEALRGWTAVPILVVSGRTDSWDKVEALDAGADDYVTKPFAVDELLARVRALSRRTPTASDEPVVSFGDVVVDLGARVVTRNGSMVRLTPTEWRILELLVRNPGRLVTRETLLTEVWGPQYTSDTGYLRLYLSQLRKKLEPEPSTPRYLMTESGMGYRFVSDVVGGDSVGGDPVGPEGLEPPTSSV
ncbi:MAG: response regulator transcription factor [Pseudolysinimonas sp.]|uniref:response regulator transcription factor n=1 Tax=Pseudolysinimonas sp. TaxID=2680009 RepID=UPI003266402E